MKSSTRRSDGGFTLVEVLVALGIAGGALILILSATNAGFRKSRDSRESLRLERLAESKLKAWQAGLEPSGRGACAGLAGYQWEVRSAHSSPGPLPGVATFALRIHGPEGQVLLERTFIRYAGGRK